MVQNDIVLNYSSSSVGNSLFVSSTKLLPVHHSNLAQLAEFLSNQRSSNLQENDSLQVPLFIN
ncbi:MAG: hypothetical protein LBQ59_01940 [Candidatus Peribacteria bacterium]|nr:hypothetical protein [Candidatus Peribacteria bacterium]